VFNYSPIATIFTTPAGARGAAFGFAEDRLLEEAYDWPEKGGVYYFAPYPGTGECV